MGVRNGVWRSLGMGNEFVTWGGLLGMGVRIIGYGGKDYWGVRIIGYGGKKFLQAVENIGLRHPVTLN